jgi:hypothetical protein
MIYGSITNFVGSYGPFIAAMSPVLAKCMAMAAKEFVCIDYGR